MQTTEITVSKCVINSILIKLFALKLNEASLNTTFLTADMLSHVFTQCTYSYNPEMSFTPFLVPKVSVASKCLKPT